MNFNFDNKITNMWSEKDDLHIAYRENGKRKKTKIENFPYYFLVSYYDYCHHYIFRQLEGSINGFERVGDYMKIYCSRKIIRNRENVSEKYQDSEAKRLVDALHMAGIKTYEADLHSAKRFMIDNPVQISDEYDILYFDIETDDTERKIRVGETRILSIGAIGSDGKEYYFDDEDEKLMIEKFLDILKNYDVLASWNGDEFDLPYIKGGVRYEGEGDERKRIEVIGRMERLGIKAPHIWHRIAHIDLLKRARKVYKEDSSIKSYSLENICQHFLHKGKIKFKGRVVDLSQQKLREYNMHDVELLKELDEKLGMINMVGKMCAFSKTLFFYFGGLYVGEVIDSMIIREAHENGMFVPTNVKREREPYVGAYVFEPEPGFYENVVCFDFKSLYPSIISTFNIGFDSIDPGGVKASHLWIKNPGTGILFNKNRKSIVASAVEKLVEARQEYKQERLRLVGEGKMKSEEYETTKANELVVKELSNSVYGILGSQYHRYYSKPLAESITRTGQFLFHLSKAFFERRGLRVIYGDTDSIFVQWNRTRGIEETMDEYHKGLHQILKERFNCKDVNIYLKYEKLFSKLIMLGKKYYVGKVTNIEGKNVNEQIVKGIDMVKKGTLNLTTQVQQGVIDLVYDNSTIDSIKKFLVERQENLVKNQWDFDQLKIIKGVGEALGDYSPRSQNQPHIMAAKKMVAKMGYLETNTVEYVVVNKQLESDDEDKIALEEEYTGEFDFRYYWNEHLLSSAVRILEVVHPSVDWAGEFELKYPKKERHIAKGQLSLF